MIQTSSIKSVSIMEHFLCQTFNQATSEGQVTQSLHFYSGRSKTKTLRDESSWNLLMMMLEERKLLPSTDAKKLSKYTPAFPCDFQTFMNILTSVFKMKEDLLKKLRVKVDDSTELVSNMRTFLSHINLGTLTHQELRSLYKFFMDARDTYEEAVHKLKGVSYELQTRSQNLNSQIWDSLINSIGERRSGLPHEWQRKEAALIEKEFQNIRVRSVHYRNQAIKTIKILSNGIKHQIAYCSDKDFPLQNIKIPRDCSDFQLLSDFYNQISAHKQLIFSKYYRTYYGFDDIFDESYNQYFFQILKGRNLKQVVRESLIPLHPSQDLFRYWSMEICFALRDLVYKSTHKVKSKIILENICVGDQGLKIFLKDVRFGDERQETQEAHKEFEALILSWYAQILIELATDRMDIDIRNQRDRGLLIQDSEIKEPLISIIVECLNTKNRVEELKEQYVKDEILRVVGRMKTAEVKQVSTFLSEKERLLSFAILMLHPYYVEATFNYEELVERYEGMRRNE